MESIREINKWGCLVTGGQHFGREKVKGKMKWGSQGGRLRERRSCGCWDSRHKTETTAQRWLVKILPTEPWKVLEETNLARDLGLSSDSHFRSETEDVRGL